jgi:predicted helicase
VKLLDVAKQEHQQYAFELEKLKEVSMLDLDKQLDFNQSKISWSSKIKTLIAAGKELDELLVNTLVAIYRPFTKNRLYNNLSLIERPGKSLVFFAKNNLVISTSGKGVSRGFSSIMADVPTDYEIVGKSQVFPLYYYTESAAQAGELFATQEETKYTRHDAITDWIHKKAQAQYGNNVTKEDIFYYVYGFLHSPNYRETFKNDLKKSLPRLPLVDSREDFWKFSNAGRALGDLHVNYETVAPNAEVTVTGAESGNFRVQKMRFPNKDHKHTIIYNSKIKLENIPAKAYEYVVNGKSAIEWIMERYQVKTDPKSGIKNDPNDWAEEVGNPRYILDLLLSVVEVSVRTVEVVASLPGVDFED